MESKALSDVISVTPLVFVMWVFIAGAYMDELAGCQMRRLLGTSMVAKHVTGIIVVYYSVILTSDETVKEFLPIKRLVMTLLLYAWFVLMTRCDAPVIIATLCVIFVIYLVSQSTHSDEEDDMRAKRTMVRRLFYVAVALTVTGVTLYARRKMIEYGDQFDWATFFVGRMRCDSLRVDSDEIIEPV